MLLTQAGLLSISATGAVPTERLSVDGNINTSGIVVHLNNSTIGGGLDIRNANAGNVTAHFRVPSTTAGIYIVGAQLNASYDYAGNDGLFSVNYVGYQNSTAVFRDFGVFDGKNTSIARFVGSTAKTGLGAGNSVPTETLSVLGNANLSGLRVHSNIIGPTSFTDRITWKNNTPSVMGTIGSIGDYPSIWLGENARAETGNNYSFLYLDGGAGLGPVFNTVTSRDIGFYLNNATQLMLIKSTGNVGISDMAPTNHLSIGSTGGMNCSGITTHGLNALTIRSEGGPANTSRFGGWGGSTNYTGFSLNGDMASAGNYTMLGSTTDLNVYINRPGGYGIYIREGNNAQHAILAGGKFGLNTITPTHELSIGGGGTVNLSGLRVHSQITGPVAFVDRVTINTVDQAATIKIGTQDGQTSYGAIGLAGSIGAGLTNFASSIGDTNLYINRPSSKDILFRIADNNQHIFKADGKVGLNTINTNAPTETLSVEGNINSSGLTVLGSRVVIKPTSAQANSLVVYTSNGSSKTTIGDYTGNPVYAALHMGTIAPASTNFFLAGFNGDHYINTVTGAFLHFQVNNSTESMTVNGSTGKVGMLTTDPTEQLSVNGNINTSGIRMHGSILNGTTTDIPGIYTALTNKGYVDSGTFILSEFYANSYQPVTSGNSAVIDTLNGHTLINFYGGQNRAVTWEGQIRGGSYSGNNLALVLTYAPLNGLPTQNIIWKAEFERHQNQVTNLNNDSYNTGAVNKTVGVTSGINLTSTAIIELTPSEYGNVQPGESFRMRLHRMGASDTLAGNVGLLKGYLKRII